MHRAGDLVQVAAAALASSASFETVSLWVKHLHSQLLAVDLVHPLLLAAVLPRLSLLFLP